MAKFGFDSSEVDVNERTPGNYALLEPGDYTLKALEAEEKETSTGGVMIKAKFEVVKGEHAGRWIWQNFNIVNKSEKAQKIGRQQLVAWATAVGKPDADDTDKLLDKPFLCTLGVDKGTGGYADSNTIKAFLFNEASAVKAPAVAKAAPAAAPKAASAAKAANPWD